MEAIRAKQRRLAWEAAEGTIDREAAWEVNRELTAQLDAAVNALAEAQARLARLPDQEAQRGLLRAAVACPDLRAEPVQVVSARLQRAGVRGYVEEGGVVGVAFGEGD